MNIIKKLLPKKIYIFLINIRDYFKYLFIVVIEFFDKKKYEGIKVRSNAETVNLIINEKMSLSRFGDGEFKWIFKEKQNSFQDENDLLSKRLYEIFTSETSKLLISIPDVFNDLSIYNRKAKIFWTIFRYEEFGKMRPMLDYNKTYSNTAITRPYIDYKDKSDVGKKYELLKKIWDDKEIVIIEGKNTKLGVRNDLLLNAKSIQRIICPSTNAFDKYDEILNEAKKISKNKLILVSLGPTATVLAYDLCINGYQVIDTGHVDIEYEWFLSSSKGKEKVEGKSVNEAGTNIIDYNECDEQYLSSIIKRIGE